MPEHEGTERKTSTTAFSCGLLGYAEDWIISSNTEAGDGYCDIRIEDEKHRTGIVIEMKYAEDGDLRKHAEEP